MNYRQSPPSRRLSTPLPPSSYPERLHLVILDLSNQVAKLTNDVGMRDAYGKSQKVKMDKLQARVDELQAEVDRLRAAASASVPSVPSPPVSPGEGSDVPPC